MVYVLLLSPERHAFLETEATFVEPVSKGVRSMRNETTLVLKGKEFTHMARGTIAQGRITLRDVRRLARPVQFLEMPLIIPARLRTHARRIFSTGGKLPPKTGRAILDALIFLMPELRAYTEE